MRKLRISTELSLPLDTVTSTIIVYGGKGMGKTVFGSVLAEEFAANDLRWAWLDPLGVSHGIRHSASGKGPGVKCLILGGVHGDIPIDPSGGAAVADVVIEETCNVLIDFSRTASGKMWGVGEKIRFCAAYARRLFERQGELIKGRKRSSLMQILDEGARYIPQNIPHGSPHLSECVAAWQQFAEEGRNVGLGLCVLTQRSARLNKDIAELADAMFAFRTIGPNSLAAVLDWLGEHVEKARIRELGELTRKLPRGSALVVSPGWLEVEAVVPIRMRRTFDSSATPKAGERPRIAKGSGAKPDIAKIKARMAAQIEQTKANDPKELLKKVATLQKEKADLEKALAKKVPAKEIETREIEIPVPMDWSWLKRELSAGLAEFDKRMHNALVDSEVLHTKPGGRRKASSQFKAPPPVLVKKAQVFAAASKKSNGSPAKPFKSVKEALVGATRDPSIGNSGLCRMMIALAQCPQGLSRRALGLRAGLSSSTGTFGTYLSRARTAGWIDGKSDFQITDAGVAALGHYEPLPTGDELFNYWLREIGEGGAGRMLRALKEAYPQALDRSELGARSDLNPSTGTFGTYLSRLRGLELIKGKGELCLSEELVG